ncbi:DNA-directed RNA polymerase subunit omega [Campylobacter sp. MOP51]|uniref:DNA-directed RNA polymerase subunit omega n=1 Tax=Campylobacter canis TaxID=3378588 RepID=UPI003C4624BF
MRLEEVAARALKTVGNDRYKLSLVVAKRAEALAAGAKSLLDKDVSKMKFADIALCEIAEGKIGLEGIVEDNK